MALRNPNENESIKDYDELQTAEMNANETTNKDRLGYLYATPLNPTSPRHEVSNYNDMILGKIYHIFGGTNAPVASQIFIVQNIGLFQEYMVQIAISVNTGLGYSRAFNETTWSSWRNFT